MNTFKDHGIVLQLSERVGRAAHQLARKVIADIGRNDLKGREETITPMIAREFTAHLIDDLKKELDASELNGVSIRVHCYKHTEENYTGADFACILKIKRENREFTKAIQAQAKVAKSAYEAQARRMHLRAGDENLLRQCKLMARRSAASFVFVYSKYGVHVVPASAVLAKNTNYIDTTSDNYKGLDGLFGEFFGCFIGDTKLGRSYRNVSSPDDTFKKMRVGNGIAIDAEMP